VTTSAALESALFAFFEDIDHERFDRMAGRLDPHVELADELTGEWLRGKERVAAYLRAQKGVVTDVSSRLGSLSSRWLTDDVGLMTFEVEQRYSLDGVPRREALTGTAIFSFRGEHARLLLFHLGAAANARPAPEPYEAAAPAGASTVESLGEALARRRRELGLSLRELAPRSGLSPSFLSQVERGLADPSVSSLRKIAEALDLRVFQLLGEDAPGGSAQDVVVRKGKRRRVDLLDAGATYELLSPEGAGGLEVTIVTLEPYDSVAPPRVHAGDEFLLVLDGALLLVYGEEEVELKAGDAATIDGSVPHRLAAAGRQARYLSATARLRG
jgi:transcriptional regulator with XRE-family HTH domain